MKESSFEKQFQYPCQYCGECPVWLSAFEKGMGLDTWDDVIKACHEYEKKFADGKCPVLGKYVTLEDIGNNKTMKARYLSLKEIDNNIKKHAERLAQNVNKLAIILYTYCQVGECKGCVFEKECPEMKCDRVGFDWKEWLEQNAEK